MALTVNHLTAGKKLTSGTSATTASVSPAQSVVFLAVSIRNAASTDPSVSSISGCSLTWVSAGTREVWDNTSTSRRATSIWVGTGTPSSGTITINFSETEATCSWTVDEVGGADSSAPVVQSNHGNNANSGNDLTITLSAFGSVNNGVYAAYGEWNALVPTQDTGYTLTYNNGDASNDPGIASQFYAGNDTSVYIDFGAPDFIGGQAVEIKAAAAGTSVKDLIQAGFIPFAR